MRDDTKDMQHPAEMALAAWLDERSEDGGVAAHVAACAACRERVAELEDVLAALRDDPPAPDPAALAENRARIAARIGSVRPVSGARSWRRHGAWWIPTAAAALLAAVLVLRGGGDGPPAPPSEAVVEAPAEPSLPVVAAASEAAEAAAAVLAADVATAAEASGGDAAPAAALADVAILEGDPLPGAGIADFDLVEEFVGLEADDQEAVLMELAAMDFEL